jgi:type IV secretory pathway VirB4 component
MGIDPWDWACDGARHVVMAGQGASMLAKALALETLTVPEARIIVVSADSNYRWHSERWGGEAVAIGDAHPAGGNPFGVAAESVEEVAFENALVAAMASPKDELSAEQRQSLDRVMGSVRAARGPAMMLDDIVEACAADPDPVARQIADMLTPWAGDGPLAPYLSDDRAPCLAGRCTVLDIGALKGNPARQRVVLLSLLARIGHAFRGADEAQRKLLVLDVALSLVRDDLAGPLGGFYRMMSARGVVVVTVAGDLGEVLGTATGRAIAEGTPNFYLLAHKNLAKRLEQLRKARPDTLSDEALTCLKSLQGGEILFSTPNGMGIGRTIQDPFRRLLLTNNASAHALIQRVQRERDLDVTDAIQYILDNDLLGREAA